MPCWLASSVSSLPAPLLLPLPGGWHARSLGRLHWAHQPTCPPSFILGCCRCCLQGQWKQISRYYVPSRTPTQVASHAQKHFLRQSGAQKRRSRFSAVEEAAVAAPASSPLSALQQVAAAAAEAAAARAAGVPAAAPAPPSLFAHALPPVQHPFHLPQPRLPAGGGPPALPGTVVGGIAMGVPIGVLPPLPSITTASA